MSKSKGKGIYKGLKGWEINYLKQAEKYGHIGDKKVKQNKTNKRGK